MVSRWTSNMKKTFYIIILISFSNLIFGQEIKAGKKECKNLFYINADLDGDELELEDFGLKKEVWFCKVTMTQDKRVLKNFLFVQTEIAPKDKLKQMIDSISNSPGELFIQLRNANKEYEGFLYYKHFDNDNGVVNELYTSTTKDSTNQYNFYKPTSSKLDTVNYLFTADIKTLTQSNTFTFKLNPAQIKREIKIAEQKKFAAQNYFDWNKGTGRYNGNKLYLGPKGGIFYYSANSKVYVTQEVRSWRK